MAKGECPLFGKWGKEGERFNNNANQVNYHIDNSDRKSCEKRKRLCFDRWEYHGREAYDNQV